MIVPRRPPATARVAQIVSRIAAIPRGRVSAYSDIDPGAPRLVGRVLAWISEDIPWQRVVRANGQAPIGIEQIELLRREGVPFRGDRVDMPRARFSPWRRDRSRRRARGRRAPADANSEP